MNDKIKLPERPKIDLIIDNGFFDPFVRILVKLGLCHQKERIQAEHPDANVRYSWESSLVRPWNKSLQG